MFGSGEDGSLGSVPSPKYRLARFAHGVMVSSRIASRGGETHARVAAST